jgi:hypothetical protein
MTTSTTSETIQIYRVYIKATPSKGGRHERGRPRTGRHLFELRV